MARVTYCEPAEVAKQLAYRVVDDPRLTRVAEAASNAIDDWLGKSQPFAFDAVPPMVQEVCLSLSCDIWKQPDATFGIMGLSETGPVRVARDLVMRYDASLIPYYEAAWGLA